MTKGWFSFGWNVLVYVEPRPGVCQLFDDNGNGIYVAAAHNLRTCFQHLLSEPAYHRLKEKASMCCIEYRGDFEDHARHLRKALPGHLKIEPSCCRSTNATPEERTSMTSHAQEELAGIRWIEHEFERISHERGIEYRDMGWNELTFYVHCVGDEKRRGMEFTHAEIRDCAKDTDVQRYLSALLSWMLRPMVATIVRLHERLDLTRLAFANKKEQT